MREIKRKRQREINIQIIQECATKKAKCKERYLVGTRPTYVTNDQGMALHARIEQDEKVICAEIMERKRCVIGKSTDMEKKKQRERDKDREREK